MTPDKHDVRTIDQLKDDLKLQAWLARAELRNPSVHKDIKALAQMRDELRLQVALGKLEALEDWDKVENRWLRVKAKVEDTAEEAGEELKGLLSDIRAAYDRMTN